MEKDTQSQSCELATVHEVERHHSTYAMDKHSGNISSLYANTHALVQLQEARRDRQKLKRRATGAELKHSELNSIFFERENVAVQITR